jgi:hypothetical protein
MFAQPMHVQNWNGPDYLGDIKNDSLAGTFLTLFSYSGEKVVQIGKTVSAHRLY